jgi:hypothetical protein
MDQAAEGVGGMIRVRFGKVLRRVTIVLAPWLVALACSSGFVYAAESDEMESFIAGVMAGKAISGDPYDLGGNRLVFGTWHFIRPGSLLWKNSRGELINTAEEGAARTTYGPWDARLERPSSPHGIDIVAQTAKRMGPILIRDRPWEKSYVIFRTVLRDGDRYKAWAKSHPGGECYLESRDGFHWERPVLRLRAFEGSLENNLLDPGPEGSVFIDPVAAAGERYKSVRGPKISFEQFKSFVEKYPDRWDPRAVKGYWRSPEKFRALEGAVSPDGVHWKVLPVPFTLEHSDGVEVGHYPASEEVCDLHSKLDGGDTFGFLVRQSSDTHLAGRGMWIGAPGNRTDGK